MTSYNTGNPIGSKDPRDLYDNAENLDEAVNTRQAELWNDRFGVARKTWHGMEQDFQQFLIDSGYVNIGDYAAGLEITKYNQIFRHEGEWWRAAATTELPYTTTGDWATEGGLFVGIGEGLLRQELAQQGGAGLIGYQEETVEAAIDDIFQSLSNKTGAKSFFDFLTEDEKERVTSKDDTLDLTVKLQAAADSNLSIYFPSGLYITSDQILFNQPTQIWTGEGRGTTEIRLTQSGVHCIRANQGNGFVLRGFKITSPNDEVADSVRLFDCERSGVVECELNDSGLHNLSIDRSRRCFAIRNIAIGGRTGGICSIGSPEIESECHIIAENICINNSHRWNYGAGINLYASRGCNVINNIVTGSDSLGIQLTDSRLNRVVGNITRGSYWSGIGVHYRNLHTYSHSDFNVIVGNTSEANGEHGIVCQSQLSLSNTQTGVVISGNTCLYNGSGAGGGKGIYLASGIRSFSVTGNTALYNAESGIEASAACGYGSITGNTSQNNGTKETGSAAGIRIHDTTPEAPTGSGCFHIQISSNNCMNFAGGRQDYGVEVTTNKSNNIKIIHNHTTGSRVAGVRDQGTDSVLVSASPAVFTVKSGQISPFFDNVTSLGSAATRYTTVYAQNGTISTSDVREKTEVASINEKEKSVALKIKPLLKSFKFKDSVNRKGSEARINFGVIAQDVKTAFESEGLDPHDYALFCYDSWVDDETGEHMDRYGIRYDQLLIFLVSSL